MAALGESYAAVSPNWTGWYSQAVSGTLAVFVDSDRTPCVTTSAKYKVMDSATETAYNPDSMVKPDRTITGAELTAILQRVSVKGFLFGDTGDSHLFDFNGYWAHDTITLHAGKGIRAIQMPPSDRRILSRGPKRLL